MAESFHLINLGAVHLRVNLVKMLAETFRDAGEKVDLQLLSYFLSPVCSTTKLRSDNLDDPPG